MKSFKSIWPRQLQQIKKIADCSCSLLSKKIDNKYKVVASTNSISSQIKEGVILNTLDYGLNKILPNNPLPISDLIIKEHSYYQSFLTVPIILKDNRLWGVLILLREENLLFDYESEKDVLIQTQMIADQISLYQNEDLNYNDADNPIKNHSLSYFFNEMQVVPWCLDYNTGNITYVGNMGKKYFGYDNQDWKNIDDWSQCIHPEDRRKTINLLNNYCKQGSDHILEYRIIKRNGEIVWVRDMVKVISDENNSTIKLIGLLMDITNIKQKEHHLTSLNNQLKYILNATNTILTIVDNNNQIIFHSHENIKHIKLKCYEYFSKRNSKCIECPVRRLDKNKSVFYQEIDQTTYQVTAFPFEAKKDTWHIAEVRIDITDRIRREKEIISLKNMLEFNMEAGNIGYFEYNSKEKRIYSNKVFNTITGYNFNGELITLNWLLSRFHPDDINKVLNYFTQAKKGHKLDFDCRVLHADNHYIWINYSGHIISFNNQENKPTTIAGIIKDITTSKKLLQDLVFERNNSLKASEAKSNFLASMSHEIRTPMNAIIGFTELLGKHITEPPYNGYLNSIKTSGKVLLSLINDLLDYEKIEAGKMLINKEWVDFRQLVNEIKNTFSVLANEKQIKLLIEIAEYFPKRIFIDSLKVNQILLNLVNNALKFTEHGKVTIKYNFSSYDNENEGILSFSVSDTGIGVPENKRQSIFEPFIQGDKSIEKTYRGTGLGLSIVQKLVHMMGGNISLTSEIKKGSVFSILIPNVQFSKELVESETIDNIEHNHLTFNNELILLADSIELNREVLYAMCKSIGLTCITASSESEVLNQLMNDNIKTVLMDVNITEEKPFDTIQKIRSNLKTRDLPVIAISTHQTFNQVKKVIQNGFTGFLSTPVIKSKLVYELQKHIKNTNLNPIKEGMPNYNEVSDFINTNPQMIQSKFEDKLIPICEELKEILSSDALNLFSKELNELLENIIWPDLSVYHQKLETAIKSYDFETIQKLISSFDGFIKKVNSEQIS